MDPEKEGRFAAYDRDEETSRIYPRMRWIQADRVRPGFLRHKGRSGYVLALVGIGFILILWFAYTYGLGSR